MCRAVNGSDSGGIYVRSGSVSDKRMFYPNSDLESDSYLNILDLNPTQIRFGSNILCPNPVWSFFKLNWVRVFRYHLQP